MVLAEHDVGLARWRKLYSRKGTLLGIVSYPPHWDDHLREHGGWFRFLIPEAISILDYLADEPRTFKTGVLSLSMKEKGAVELHGITPEEFEKISGCSFSPGAGYIRSLLET